LPPLRSREAGGNQAVEINDPHLRDKVPLAARSRQRSNGSDRPSRSKAAGRSNLWHFCNDSGSRSADVARCGLKKRTDKKMAAERTQNLQDTFLNFVRKNKVPLTIFLVNGVKLQGVVTWFDNFCVLLRRDGHSQLVYKHAISTIMPGHPIQMFEPGDETQATET
jgi:host factor-I protein